MSKLMMIAGILLAAVAIALGIMIFLSPGSVVAWGITPEFAAILLVGGVGALGLGGIISALEAGAAVPVSNAAVAEPGERTVIPEFGRKTVETRQDISPAVGETIKALEEARTGIQQAFGDQPGEAAQTELPAAQTATADEAGEQLYVVEERAIRSRPARILSDGTVEAETDEGWMRFENLEHLDEYLDAMAPSARA